MTYPLRRRAQFRLRDAARLIASGWVPSGHAPRMHDETGKGCDYCKALRKARALVSSIVRAARRTTPAPKDPADA